MTILLWGRAGEAVIEAVTHACRRRGQSVVIADGDQVASVDLDTDLITDDGRHVAMDSLTGLFVRPEATPTVEETRVALDALSAWAELTDAAVLNKPSAALTNRSKPYQIGVIAQAGFRVPDTLVTTDPDDARSFAGEHERVIYKSVSGVRSIVAEFDPADHGRLEDVTTCPTQFQQYVPGVDHRVHVVNEQTFTCRIRSDALDYRYAGLSGAKLAMEPTNLPDEITQRCLDTAKRLGLALAGIDLRQSPDGEWWCFEVNTSPGFIWFEQHTGLPIADAIAAALAYA